jgi:hypothetical protein
MWIGKACLGQKGVGESTFMVVDNGVYEKYKVGDQMELELVGDGTEGVGVGELDKPQNEAKTLEVVIDKNTRRLKPSVIIDLNAYDTDTFHVHGHGPIMGTLTN